MGYGTQFRKNKKTVAALNLEKYGNYTCEICKKSPLQKGHGSRNDMAYVRSGELLTIDHIVPLSKGGKHGLYNLQVCCNKCNTLKGNEIETNEDNLKFNLGSLFEQRI